MAVSPQEAVAVCSLAYPRISMLSLTALPVQEEGPPLLGRLELPLLDASPPSLEVQNWQALKRRVVVCLLGPCLLLASHGRGILPAQACAYRCLSLLWLGNLDRDNHGSHDEGTGSLPRYGCDPELQLPGFDGMLGTRCQCARGTRDNKRPHNATQ